MCSTTPAWCWARHPLGLPTASCSSLCRRQPMATTMRNLGTRGLLLTDSPCTPCELSRSAKFHPLMLSRSSHLLHDHVCRFTYGLSSYHLDCTFVSQNFLAQVHDLHVGFHVDNSDECRWRHLENLLMSCPQILLDDDLMGLECPHRDLLHAAPQGVLVYRQSFAIRCRVPRLTQQ